MRLLTSEYEKQRTVALRWNVHVMLRERLQSYVTHFTPESVTALTACSDAI